MASSDAPQGGVLKPDNSDEQTLQQPKDAVALQKIEQKEEGKAVEPSSIGASAKEATPAAASSSSAAAESTGAAAAAVPSSSASTTKGKEADKARDEDDDLAIGPTDAPSDEAGAPSTPENPVCMITLLLPTGARHPFRIDEKYLTKRNVDVPGLTESGKKDPFTISIYKLKELILREWREEWETKPASPSSIRLIHFGKLLDDKEQLKKYQFSAENPNVVHMSVRPAEMMEEDEAGKSGGQGGRSRESSGGCCVIL